MPDEAASEAVADKEQEDVQDPADELVSVSDGLLQEDNDVIEVEGNDTQNITDGEDDTEDEDF